MTTTRLRSARTILFVAAMMLAAGGLPSQAALSRAAAPAPISSGSVTDGAPGVVRVIVHGGDTDAFFRGLGRISDFKLVYRYEIIRGAAVAVPASRAERVLDFAGSTGLKAEHDMEIHADLTNSARTTHVKANNEDTGAWSLGFTGAGVTIAIIDSGIYAQHSGLDDLDDNPATTDPKVIKFKDWVNNGGGGAEVAPYDDNDHGSHVAGIAAGTGGGSTGDGPNGKNHVGMAYRANLAGFKVFNSAGTGSSTNFIAALDWIRTNPINPPIRVVNYSGGSTPTGGNNNGNSAQSLAVDAASDAGIVVVAAGGNGDTDGLLPNQTPGNLNIPADARKGIAVCSSDNANPPTAPAYSDWDSEGPTGDGRIKPDVCAPGDLVQSVNSPAGTSGGPNSYVGFGGTSMSSPHVAGIAALIIQAVPSISPDQVREVLFETAREYVPGPAPNGKNNDRGFGEVNAKRAIELAISRYGGNLPLTVSSGGPYSVIQNESRTLTATATRGLPPYAFAWDLDNNGSFETSGRSVTFPASQTATTGDRIVNVRVTDSAPSPATATASATVSVLAPVTVFSDNVDGGLNGWAAAGTPGPGWHRTTIRKNSGTHSWYAGDDLAQQYAPLQDSTLTRTFDFSSGPAATSGQILFRFARSGDLEPEFDFLRVEARVAGEPSFGVLAEFDDELGTAWVTSTVDLSAYKGSQMELRFRFTSDELIQASGPFVDDIRIIGTVAPAVDTVPPGQITNLAAGVPAVTSIPLTWTATGDDGNVGTATSYDLRYATAPINAGNFGLATPAPSAPAPLPSGSAQSATVTGLQPNTTYYFAIKALDEASNSGPISNLVSAVTLPDTIEPSKVTGLSGSAGDGKVTLNWTAATDNVAVTGYQIIQDLVLGPTTTETSATVTGLTNGTTYSFRVRARDAAGNWGLPSDPINLTPFATPTVGGWAQPRGGASRTGHTQGRGSIAVPSIRQTLGVGSNPFDASPLVVDLDGDGKMDVVVVSDQTGATPTTVVALRQTPSGLAPMWTHTVPMLIGSSIGWGNIAVGDLDANGSPEVVLYANSASQSPVGGTVSGGGQTITNTESRVRVLKGIDGAMIGEVGPAEVRFGIDSSPVIGDVSGDGIPEAIIIHDHGTGTPPGFHLMSVHLTGGVVSAGFNTAITGNGWTSLALGEFTSNDGLELVAGRNGGNSAGTVLLCEPTAGGAGCNQTVTTTTGIMGVSVADLDGNGPPEIVANGRTGNSLNVVKTTPSMTVVSQADGLLWNTASLADVDGDAKADIVNVEYSAFVDDTDKIGDVTLRGFNGSSIVDKGKWARTPAPGGDAQSKGGGALVDIAGDARPEFVFGTSDGNLVAASFNSPPAQLWSTPVGADVMAPVAVGDVTGDGLLDVVSATSAGTVVVVGAGPFHHIALAPQSASVAAGVAQVYTATAYDAVGNPLGDVTSETSFSIDNGSCLGASCKSTTPGTHTVTGTRGTASATATLNVTAGPLHHLQVSPSPSTITAGGSRTYSAQGFDEFNNSLGDVTGTTTFSIAPDGGCSGNVCTATKAGTHTITASNGPAMGSANLTVEPGPLHHLALSPADSTVAIGASQSYTAQGRDAYDNSLGDRTAGTVFTIAPDGGCTGNSCSAGTTGVRTVTGRFGTATGTATLRVVNAVNYLVLTPASATITAGGSQAYSAEGFDEHGVSVGDVTSSTVFTVTPDGSCTGNVCTAYHASDHVVTGNFAGAVGTAILRVNSGPLARLIITPGYAVITSGNSRAYLASGRDAFGNSLGDQTPSTVFTITPDGSCSGNVCTATVPGSHTVTGTKGAITGTATLQVNPVAPIILGPAQGAFTPPSVTVSGTAPVGSTVRLADNGVEIASNVTVDSSGNWSLTHSFAPGSHSLTARAFMAPSSLSDPSATRTFVVDSSPPNVSITRPSGYLLFQPVVGGAVTVRGSASDQGIGVDRVELVYTEAFSGARIRATLPCPGACGSFGWRDDRTIPGGYWTVEAVAFDRAGNRSNAASISLFVMNAP